MGLIMVLINGLFMLYVTRQDGTRRELRGGRVQRFGLVAIDVYDENNIWSRTSRGIASGVGVSSSGKPIDGDVEPQDMAKFFMCAQKPDTPLG
jgi:hypothetical protein